MLDTEELTRESLYKIEIDTTEDEYQFKIVRDANNITPRMFYEQKITIEELPIGSVRSKSMVQGPWYYRTTSCLIIRRLFSAKYGVEDICSNDFHIAVTYTQRKPQKVETFKTICRPSTYKYRTFSKLERLASTESMPVVVMNAFLTALLSSKPAQTVKGKNNKDWKGRSYIFQNYSRHWDRLWCSLKYL